MNDVTYLEAARVLAERAMREGGAGTDDRLAWAFRAVTARTPVERERQLMRGYFDSQLAWYSAHPNEATKILSSGVKRHDQRIAPPELAAWSMVASLLFNLDETINRQ